MHLVAKDKTPLPDEIGIGSTVFFPQVSNSLATPPLAYSPRGQGNYRGDANYNRDAGTHWHLGIIEDINTSGDHVLYSGKHTRGDADGKWTTFKGLYAHATVCVLTCFKDTAQPLRGSSSRIFACRPT